MKVVIVGAGNVGTFISTDLQANGHDVTLMEKDYELAKRLAPTLPVKILAADACEVSNLQRAEVGDADVVVAATGDDEDNLVVSLLAKQEFAVPRVVARVNHPKNHWLFNEAWGVDVAVSTPHLLTGVVEEAVSVGSLVRLLQLEQGEANLVEVTLADDSPADGRSIADLAMPRDATVVAVIRGGHVVVPRGDTVLVAGDEVLALVTPRSLDEVRTLLIAGPDGRKPGSVRTDRDDEAG
ncbi:MAG TPA: TrkA family potassium uptake protein [Acidimicrobiales bacterium]|nr:TrkA family potassium uptake protein [Acidimicrobiales bacterium]